MNKFIVKENLVFVTTLLVAFVLSHSSLLLWIFSLEIGTLSGGRCMIPNVDRLNCPCSTGLEP